MRDQGGARDCRSEDRSLLPSLLQPSLLLSVLLPQILLLFLHLKPDKSDGLYPVDTAPLYLQDLLYPNHQYPQPIGYLQHEAYHLLCHVWEHQRLYEVYFYLLLYSFRQ